MKVYNDIYKDIGYFFYRLSSPFIDPIKIFLSAINTPYFIRDFFIYSHMNGAEPLKIINLYPILHEKVFYTPFDKHYFYQDFWAFKKILDSKAKSHFDIGSSIEFAKFLTAITKVVFIDIRPLQVKLDNFESRKGNILSLPFADNSIYSLSCLHVAEHVGLGRYGDKLNPYGTKKACQELSRVLAPGGNLYFSLPVGRPKLCFNAHRIHSPKKIFQYFTNLKLVEFSGIDDRGNFLNRIDLTILENSNYACGLFWFRKVK